MSRVVVYGMSHAGITIAAMLRQAGADVVAAALPGSDHFARLEALQVPVVSGNLQDGHFLRSLGLDKAAALVLPAEDELFNLNAALQAVEINPEIRVVIRLFNLNLGRKLEKTVRNFIVLSVSQLASSSFASAALIDRPLLSFEQGDEILNIFSFTGPICAGMTVGELEEEEEIKVLAKNDTVLPGPGEPVMPGDRLTVFSRFQSAYGLSGTAPCSIGQVCEDRGKQGTGSFLRQVDPVLVRTVSALGVVAAACILYFHHAERLSFLDAGYFVVTILTTVGFGDINLKDSGALSKVVGMGLMLSGMALMAMLFAMVSDNLLKKRLDLFLGRRRTRLRGHVILCGLGDVGIRVLEDLVRTGQRVVVVEQDNAGKFVASVRHKGIPVIISDAAHEDTLRNANISAAKAIICATDNDIRNLEVGLNATALHPGIRVVLRIFDQDLAAKIEKHFSIPAALSSSAIAAPAFVAAALDTGTIGLLDLNGRKLEVKRQPVGSSREVEALASRPDLKLLMLEKENGDVFLKGFAAAAAQGDRIVFARYDAKRQEG